MMRYDSVRETIGHTPLVKLAVEASRNTEVYAKLELANPFGMKDRVARFAIEEARRTGTLREGAPIIESSSGTLALGIGLVGRSLGHPVHIVTDPRIDSTTLKKLQALGVEVHTVPSMTSQGWQGARLEHLHALLADLPGALWLRQYSNPDNPRAYRSLANELIDDLGNIDVLIGAVGSGGSLCGTTRALRRSSHRLRVVGVDTVGSALFGQPNESGRLQSGLGNSLSPGNLDRREIDEIHWLNDVEAFSATRGLAAEQQIFAGNTSGSVYRVLTHVAQHAPRGSRIVGIFPDRGDRYAQTVYDDEYWQTFGVIEQVLTQQPAQVAYGTPVSSWSKATVVQSKDEPKRLIFVEANTSGSGMQALAAAHRLGLVPVLLTADPSRYRGLAEIDAEVDVVVCNTSSTSALQAHLESVPRQSIVGIFTTSDFYVSVVAELADWLDLPGNPAHVTTVCRDKAALRMILRSVGLPQPTSSVIHSTEDITRALLDVPAPWIVKPVSDSGSNGVRLCTTSDEAREHVESLLAATTNARGLPVPHAVIVEKFLSGPEYSVETVSEAGRHTCVGITEKRTSSGPTFVELEHMFPARLTGTISDEIVNTVSRALDVVGWQTGAAHTEVKVGPDAVTIIEINPRLAGGMIPELVRQALGVDLVEQQLRLVTGMRSDLSARHRSWAGITCMTSNEFGRLAGVDGVRTARQVSGISHVAVTTSVGDTVRPATSAYDRLGYIIAHGSSPEAVTLALDTASSNISIRVEPNAEPHGSVGSTAKATAGVSRPSGSGSVR